MRSDNQYERLFGLWVSLWNLVLENKRHLETVAAALQRIVFEQRGFPRFKNWSAICRLAHTNRFGMMAVATLDLNRDGDVIHQIMAAFPECFSYKETSGPVPLSVIRHAAEQNAAKYADVTPNPGDYPASLFDGVPSWIPQHVFFTEAIDLCLDATKLPSQIDPKTPQGSTVIWEGKQFVVLENNSTELYIAPAECVACDL